MNLAKFWSGDQFILSNASIFPVFHKEKVLGAVWQILFAVKSKWKVAKMAKILLDFTWISLILIQEYMKYEEYVQFALIAMDKVHMGQMCMWVLCKVNVFS